MPAVELKVLIGQRLAIVREHFKLRHMQRLADILEVEHDRYRAWEKGINPMPIVFADLLETKLGVSSDWILSRDPQRMKLELVVNRPQVKSRTPKT